MRSRYFAVTALCLSFGVSGVHAYGPTGTGLDRIVDIINTDEKLQSYVSLEALETATQNAYRMNEIILEAIYETGSANDGSLSGADARTINKYIYNNYSYEWIGLHGNDEKVSSPSSKPSENSSSNSNSNSTNNLNSILPYHSFRHVRGSSQYVESGFHYVRGNGNQTRLFGKNAIDSVADAIYHLGFESDGNKRLNNEDGNCNKDFMEVAFWLDELLAAELETDLLINPDVEETQATTETGLDMIVEAIYADQALHTRVSLDEIRDATHFANQMNVMIMEAIEAEGVNADGYISIMDAKVINRYLYNNYRDEWVDLHGDDEKDPKVETGYHLVQSDGAKTYLFGENMIDTVFDGLYHLGFQAHESGERLLNEDGDKNASFETVAYWLDTLINHR